MGGVNFVNNYILNIENNTTQIDLSLLPSGTYVLSLLSDGEISDSKTILKQ